MGLFSGRPDETKSDSSLEMRFWGLTEPIQPLQWLFRLLVSPVAVGAKLLVFKANVKVEKRGWE